MALLDELLMFSSPAETFSAESARQRGAQMDEEERRRKRLLEMLLLMRQGGGGGDRLPGGFSSQSGSLLQALSLMRGM
jgi:hypothetical protein